MKTEVEVHLVEDTGKRKKTSDKTSHEPSLETKPTKAKDEKPKVG